MSLWTFTLVTPAACAAEGGERARPSAPDGGEQVATLEAAIGPFTLAPGTESTRCIVFRLDNPDGAFVRRMRAALGRGSHHMTVYLSQDLEERREPFDCLGFDSIARGDRPLFIAQQETTELRFPSDEDGAPVGPRIEARQMVRMEMHHFNTTSGPAAVRSVVTLDTVPISTRVVEADIAFWGTNDIHIPPGAAHETPVKFVEALPGMRSFALTTHQHHLGTGITVWHGDGPDDTAGAPLVVNTDWANPALHLFDPPLAFGQRGRAGLAFKCAWDNPTPREVVGGESIDDEMCIVWHYYYPARGFLRAVVP